MSEVHNIISSPFLGAATGSCTCGSSWRAGVSTYWASSADPSTPSQRWSTTTRSTGCPSRGRSTPVWGRRCVSSCSRARGRDDDRMVCSLRACRDLRARTSPSPISQTLKTTSPGMNSRFVLGPHSSSLSSVVWFLLQDTSWSGGVTGREEGVSKLMASGEMKPKCGQTAVTPSTLLQHRTGWWPLCCPLLCVPEIILW